jgi:DNA-binding transcriptional ArsR family regulator
MADGVPAEVSSDGAPLNGHEHFSRTPARQYLQIILNHMVDFSSRADIVNHMVKYSSLSLDRVFHALAHPARRAMLRQLAGGERNLSELASPFRMSFPAASKHVRVLERARLVRRRIVGRTHLCTLKGKPLGKASDFLENYRRFWEESFERLDDLLEELQTEEPKPGRAGNDRNCAGNAKSKGEK